MARTLEVISGTHADPRGAMAGTLAAAKKKLEELDQKKVKIISHNMSERVDMYPPSVPGGQPRVMYVCTITYLIEVSDLVAATTEGMNATIGSSPAAAKIKNQLLGADGRPIGR